MEINGIDLGKIKERGKLLADKERCLSSTVNFARYTGSNCYNPSAQIWPWHDIQERVANYLDKPIIGMSKPIKLISVARGHLKTEVGVNWACRYILDNPNSRNGICGATSQRGKANLSHISRILTSDNMLKMFKDKLYNPKNEGSEGRFAYTNDSILLKRSIKAREKTITAFGLDSNTTGVHLGAGSFLWFDDPVVPENVTTPELREKVAEKITYLIEAVCDPGCQIIFTYTRYHFDDYYAQLINPNGAFSKSIVDGAINVGCYDIDEFGARQAIYPFRYCWDSYNRDDPVIYKGKKYFPIRESLAEKKLRMCNAGKTELWYAQFENTPLVKEGAAFKAEYFQSVLPCHGKDFVNWIADANNAKEHVHDGHGDRGNIEIKLLGDPSYGKGRQNDFAVLLVVAQDIYNHWYILDAMAKRMGYQGARGYIQQALDWIDKYHAHTEAAIETHAKEAIEDLAFEMARNQNKTIRFAKLKMNAIQKKTDRIGTLEPIVSNNQLHFCCNVEEYREKLIGEALTFPQCCLGGLHDDCLDALANGTQVFRYRDSEDDEPVNMFSDTEDLTFWRITA